MVVPSSVMLDTADIIAALCWQIEIGADEAIAESPTDWTTLALRLVPARRPAQLSVSKADASVADVATRRPIEEVVSGGTAVNAVNDARAIAAAAGDLAALEAALQQFNGCSLKHTATNLVFADGNPHSRLMLIGEAPGGDEDRQGRPFAGEAGLLLDRMLAAIGLDRTQAYLANILPWRPPGNRSPTPAEISLCLPFIERHIALVNPLVVVVFGLPAAKILLNQTGVITKLRGRWFQYRASGMPQASKAIITYHPAYLLHTPHLKAEAWLDLISIKRIINQ